MRVGRFFFPQTPIFSDSSFSLPGLWKRGYAKLKEEAAATQIKLANLIIKRFEE